jgi:hypothetical protein
MKVLDSIWFINCGIVKVQTEYEGIKYYIRGLQAGEWSTPERDADYVANWGSTFPQEAGALLFGEDELRNGSAVQIPKNREQAETMIKVATMYLDIK